MVPEYPGTGRRTRRWERISWRFSLVLVLPILGFLITFAWPSGDGAPGLKGIVKDAYTGRPVSGAVVSTANATATTSGDGKFSVPDLRATSLNVSREHYESVQLAVATVDERLEIKLRPTTIDGVVKNARNGDPVPGATVTMSGPDGTVASITTNDKGEYRLENVPAGAVISVVYEGLTLASRPAEDSSEIDFEVRADVLIGRVTDTSGRPISGAKVSIGDLAVTTGADGTYRLVGIPESGTVSIRKAGYVDFTAGIPDSLELNTELEGSQVRAVYVPLEIAGNDQRWAQLLEIARSTEINAVVLDLKDATGHVLYDSQVPLAVDAGTRMPAFDLSKRIEELNDQDLYVIGRISVFQDPALAEARPDLAITDVTTGALWRTWDGLAWVNPYHPDVWTYNVDLAVEAAEMGIDEIHLDAVRFPSDGILDTAGFGEAYMAVPKTEAITGFLTQMRNELAASGAYLGVATSGLSVWAEDDGNIGEDFVAIASLVDVISPKLFPSHFYPGELGFDIPNDHPYDVVLKSLQMAVSRVPDAEAKLRPWLQDFSYGEGIQYGAAEVGEQIRAVHELEANGWMIWNPDGDYADAPFEPE